MSTHSIPILKLPNAAITQLSAQNKQSTTEM